MASCLLRAERSAAAMMHLAGDVAQCRRAVEAFRRHDATCSGLLPAAHLGRLLRSKVFRCTDDEVKLALSLWAGPGGGSVPYAPFIAWAMRCDLDEVEKADVAPKGLAGSSSTRTVMMVLGPPGAGKGTISPILSEHYALPRLSTGDMLRAAVAAGTSVGEQAKETMAAGGLVPDELVVRLIRDRIQDKDCATGFLLDGFPRNRLQSELLDAMLAETGDRMTCVLALVVPDEALRERICGRWVHEPSGRSYHTTRAPPKSLQLGQAATSSTMHDDKTGEPLVQRPDDTEEALARRLQAYHDETAPIIAHYEPKGVVRRADADCMPQDMWSRVRPALEG